MIMRMTMGQMRWILQRPEKNTTLKMNVRLESILRATKNIGIQGRWMSLADKTSVKGPLMAVEWAIILPLKVPTKWKKTKRVSPPSYSKG